MAAFLTNPEHLTRICKFFSINNGEYSARETVRLLFVIMKSEREKRRAEERNDKESMFVLQKNIYRLRRENVVPIVKY